MNNEQAIQEVIRYMNEYLFETTSDWPRYIFEERSYERWAATEILNSLMDRPCESPDIVVEDFALRMNQHYHVSKHAMRSQIFMVARDVAEDVLEILRETERR